mmetsp:Transcript_42283/g.97876  ORF Transcript_42283/g.97876 Transcript_42283/m.97876 type:complete len:279 (+) Transcript_42283:1710-2546(+)
MGRVYPRHLVDGRCRSVHSGEPVRVVNIQCELPEDVRREGNGQAVVGQRLGDPTNFGHVLCARQRHVLHDSVCNLVAHPRCTNLAGKLCLLGRVRTEHSCHDSRDGGVVHQQRILVHVKPTLSICIILVKQLLCFGPSERSDAIQVNQALQIIRVNGPAVVGVYERVGVEQHLIFILTCRRTQFGHDLVKELLHSVNGHAKLFQGVLNLLAKRFQPLSDLQQRRFDNIHQLVHQHSHLVKELPDVKVQRVHELVLKLHEVMLGDVEVSQSCVHCSSSR